MGRTGSETIAATQQLVSFCDAIKQKSARRMKGRIRLRGSGHLRQRLFLTVNLGHDTQSDS
jgi:hypothetical protein